MKGYVLNMNEERTYNVLLKIKKHEITVKKGAQLLNKSERQIYRKLKCFDINNKLSVIHKSKNKSNGKGYDYKLKNLIHELNINEYPGWNFSHFNDCLKDYHNIYVSNYFIYNLLSSYSINSPCSKKKKSKQVHPPRNRREYAGELIQIDASKHNWFVLDNNYYYLHGAIDDATNTVVGCYLCEEETIFGYQMVLYQIIKNFGIPECLYSDYRTVFQSNKKELSIDEELDGKQINNTKFTNMLNHNGINIISTTNPMAKGRIERLWLTFQDRLVKELKKRNISDIKKANEFISNDFIPRYNSRFALPIDPDKSVFVKPLDTFDYNRDLAVWKEYSVYSNSYLKISNSYWVINDNGEKVFLPTRNKVKVLNRLDGKIEVLYNDKYYSINQVKLEFKEKIQIPAEKNYNPYINNGKTNYNSPWRKWNPSKNY